VERDRPIELDALLTVTHEIGKLVGVPTPFIDSILGLARLRAESLGLLAKTVSLAVGGKRHAKGLIDRALMFGL
jgi:hypothetical protein